MMVEGMIQSMKIREGHWTTLKSGKGLRIKLDNKPELNRVEEITLRYGQDVIPVKVKLTDWNDYSSEVIVEVVN